MLLSRSVAITLASRAVKEVRTVIANQRRCPKYVTSCVALSKSVKTAVIESEEQDSAYHREHSCQTASRRLEKLFQERGLRLPDDLIIHIKEREEIVSVRRLTEEECVGSEDVVDEPVKVIDSGDAVVEPVKVIGSEDAVVEPVKLVGVLDEVKLEWHHVPRLRVKDLPVIYMKLSKIRLTGLIVLTTMAGYAVAPASLSATTLLVTSMGTGLTSCAANAINQFLEVPYDSQMSRTKLRPLVKKQISELHAVAFACVTSVAGVALLATQVNAVCAGLALSNLILYTAVYTPMKRLSIINTWIGSVVGAIPPVIGYTAATGSLDPGCAVLAGLLYAWQFPHFNALSWNLKSEYCRAGYRMMCVTEPNLCKATAFRYSISIIGLSTLAPVVELTTWSFALDSLPPNIYLVYLAYKFYKHGDSQSSRKLFRYSLLHLPVLMALLFINKKSTNNSHASSHTEGKAPAETIS